MIFFSWLKIHVFKAKCIILVKIVNIDKVLMHYTG